MKREIPVVPKTAIIGATGFIGKFFFAAHREIYGDCIGTNRDASRKDLSYLDLLSPESAPLKLAQSGHREALILAGIAKPSLFEKEKELKRKVSVDGTLNLIQQLVDEGIKPIFFSSDSVFDGVTGHYDEESLPNPLNEYGRLKAEIEAGAREICVGGNYLIIRISKVFSLDKGDGTLFDEMAAILRSGGRVRAAYDQIFSPIFVLDLVKLVTILQMKGVSGVININSPEAWSRYDLALALAERMEVSSDHIERISLVDLQEAFSRPKNTTMKTDKLMRETGYKFTPMIKYIERIAENWKESGIEAKEISA